MKKIVIATAVAAFISSGSVMAATSSGTGEVQFFGNVSASTCNVKPEVEGGVNTLIQLGTVQTNGLGSEIPFALKADNSDGTCSSLGDSQSATVSWDGPLNDTGVTNQSGSATDAVVLVKAVNTADSNSVNITSGQNSAEFIENKVMTDGYKFTAQLQGGTTPGDYKSALAYAVTYK